MADNLDFKQVAEQVKLMTPKAQATLVFLIIQELGPSVCRTTLKYAARRIDEIYDKFPLDDPGRIAHEEHKRKRKQFERFQQPMEQLPEGVYKHVSYTPGLSIFSPDERL